MRFAAAGRGQGPHFSALFQGVVNSLGDSELPVHNPLHSPTFICLPRAGPLPRMHLRIEAERTSSWDLAPQTPAGLRSMCSNG